MSHLGNSPRSISQLCRHPRFCPTKQARISSARQVRFGPSPGPWDLCRTEGDWRGRKQRDLEEGTGVAGSAREGSGWTGTSGAGSRGRRERARSPAACQRRSRSSGTRRAERAPCGQQCPGEPEQWSWRAARQLTESGLERLKPRDWLARWKSFKTKSCHRNNPLTRALPVLRRTGPEAFRYDSASAGRRVRFSLGSLQAKLSGRSLNVQQRTYLKKDKGASDLLVTWQPPSSAALRQLLLGSREIPRSRSRSPAAPGAARSLSQSGLLPHYSSTLTPLIKGRPDGTFRLYSRYSSPKK